MSLNISLVGRPEPQEQRQNLTGDYCRNAVSQHISKPRMVFSMQSHSCFPIEVRTAHLAAPCSPVMADDSGRNSRDAIASVPKAPAEI